MNLPFQTVANGRDTVVVAWIDVSTLTRECLTRATASAQELFVILPFHSIYDCIKASDQKFDLIVYRTHEAPSADNPNIIALREAFASARLVILSDESALDPSAVKDLLKQGVVGLILASQTGLQMLVSALRLVAAGGIFIPRECLFSQDSVPSSVAKQSPKPGTLTSREVEVLQLVRQGKANKVIAFELNLSEATVKVHVRNTMRKMGSTNRTHVAMNAHRFLEAAAA